MLLAYGALNTLYMVVMIFMLWCVHWMLGTVIAAILYVEAFVICSCMLLSKLGVDHGPLCRFIASDSMSEGDYQSFMVGRGLKSPYFFGQA